MKKGPNRGFSTWVEGSRSEGWLPRWRDPETGAKRRGERCDSKPEAEGWLAREVIPTLERQATLERRRRTTIATPWPDLLKSWAKHRLADPEHPISTAYAEEVQQLVGELVDDMAWGSVVDVTPEAIRSWQVQAVGRVALRRRYLLAVLRWAAGTDEPVDPAVTAHQRGRSPRRKASDLVPDQVIIQALTRAQTLGPQHHALAHYLVTYGARPITAARLLVGDVNLVAGTLTLRDVKHTDDIVHPLRQDTRDLFATIIGQRPAAAPLFIRPKKADAWPLRGGSCNAMSIWWRERLAYDAAQRGIYEAKRWAISHMLDQGMPLHVIARYTGHRSVRSLERYLRTHLAMVLEHIHHLPPDPLLPQGKAGAKRKEVAK